MGRVYRVLMRAGPGDAHNAPCRNPLRPTPHPGPGPSPAPGPRPRPTHASAAASPSQPSRSDTRRHPPASAEPLPPPPLPPPPPPAGPCGGGGGGGGPASLSRQWPSSEPSEAESCRNSRPWGEGRRRERRGGPKCLCGSGVRDSPHAEQSTRAHTPAMQHQPGCAALPPHYPRLVIPPADMANPHMHTTHPPHTHARTHTHTHLHVQVLQAEAVALGSVKQLLSDGGDPGGCGVLGEGRRRGGGRVGRAPRPPPSGLCI